MDFQRRTGRTTRTILDCISYISNPTEIKEVLFTAGTYNELNRCFDIFLNILHDLDIYVKYNSRNYIKTSNGSIIYFRKHIRSIEDHCDFTIGRNITRIFEDHYHG